jgi:hypothetical protein
VESLIWVAPALDVAVVALLAAVLWQLRRDPTAAFDARERRLGEILEELRVLVAQSDGVARELDGALASREQALRALVAEMTAARAAPVAPPRAAAARPADAFTPGRHGTAAAEPPAVAATDAHADVVRRVRQLAATALPVEEIARRLAMPAAEVRVLVGLHARAPLGRSGGGGRNDRAVSAASAT